MNYSLLFFCLLFKIGYSLSQVTHLESFFKKKDQFPKVYAIVVGISDYKDTQLPDLSFADRDAEIFAEYLMSKAGGSVPPEQVKLLKGTDATVANVYNALSWVEKKVNKGDKFYFYFAGHGDLESSLYKLGFLLTYDTPYQNYINNAIRIEDLNNLANTLSVNKEVSTILITDACHSGKLAGSDNRGNSLIGEQLSLVQKKEIRIASCESDQKSQENFIWGGGRGVFSFYLVNGMKGHADTDKDDNVTLQELKSYLESNVSRDVMNLKLEEQNPIVSGKQSAVISKVIEHPTDSILDPVATASVGEIESRDVNDQSSQSSDLISSYFNYYKDIKLENDFEFSKIISKSRNEIPEMVFNELTSKKSKIDTNVLKALKDPEVKDRFNQGFAAMIHDQVQNAINLYLKADEVELEKRQFYNSGSSNYDTYPIMIQTALHLIDEDNYLSHILQVKLHYFKGIASRVKIPLTNHPDSLIETALREQLKALALEDKAAYVQNELGLLYMYKWQRDLAKNYFEKAITLSSTWAIPRSNLSGLLSTQKQYQEGMLNALIAKKLKPGFQGAYINLGRNYDGAGNWLFAEEQFRESLKLNAKDYVPFERLGFLYTHNMNYALADSFFIQAENLKKGFEFDISKFPEVLNSMSTTTTSNFKEWVPACLIDTPGLSQRDIMANFFLAMNYFDQGIYNEAKKILINLNTTDPSNPLSFRYLAEIYYREKNWLEAEINFKYADQNYLDKIAFLEYCDRSKLNQKVISHCIEEKYKSKHYEKKELLIFFGRLYESWGHLEEAQSYYKKIIQENPKDIAGHYLLWTMKEKLGKYEDCEELIWNFGKQNQTQAERELYAFYKRRQNADPTDYNYYYKAGNLVYNISAQLPPGDELKPVTDQAESEFNIPHRKQYISSWTDENKLIVLPGINETIDDASEIVYPRKLGISMFKEVIELSKDTIILADAYSKMGDLYYWAGANQSAIDNYQISITLKPLDASIRMRIIDNCNELFLFEQGFLNLKYLYENHQLNYDKMLLLADYDIRQSKFEEADKLLASMQAMHPVQKKEIDELKAKSALFSGNWKLALDYYLNKANQSVINPDAEYSVSRIYALKNDSKNAMKWLKKSLDHGFKYGRVIKNDLVWKQFKSSKDWKNIEPKIVKEMR